MVLTTIYCGIPPYVGVFLTLLHSLSLVSPWWHRRKRLATPRECEKWGYFFIPIGRISPFSDAYWRCYNIFNERGRGTEYRVRTTPKPLAPLLDIYECLI